MIPISIARFLATSDIGPGARWTKADFHIHLPGSSDYEYRQPDALEQLARVLTEGDYGLAVVLKHQEFPTPGELEALQRLCPRTKLIPGAEINVLVDALFKKVGKDYFCHCIVAVDPDLGGDYGYVLRKARDQFSYREGDYPAGFRSSILDIGRFFRENGALFIPAHLHQSKPPDTSRSIDDLYDDDTFLGFVSDGAFDALEVRQSATASFFDGLHSTKAGLLIPASVCVASSDAHSHQHVVDRNRATWVRVEQRTYAELVAALSFPHRVTITPPRTGHARIVGLHVVGTFIPECELVLNEGLNAMIGAKGSGKTALLECLRFALNTPVPPERRDSVNRHVAHVLGSSGYVECLVQHDGGQQELIVRRADSPDRIVITNSAGGTRTVSASEGMPFAVSILGWHEIEAVADRASTRIALLDRVGDPVRIANIRETIRQQIERARDGLPNLQRHIKRLDTSLRDLRDLRRKRSTLARLQEGELLDLQAQYEWFLESEQKLTALIASLSNRGASLEPAVRSNLDPGFAPAPPFPGTTPAEAALQAVRDGFLENAGTEADSVAALRLALVSLHASAEAAAHQVAAVFAGFRDNTYVPRISTLPPEDREILSRQIQVLEETKRLPIVEKECNDSLGDVVAVAKELRQFCQAVCDLRGQIASIRAELVDALNVELDGVKLRFLASANQEARTGFHGRHKEEGHAFTSYLQTFGGKDSYENLVALFESLEAVRIETDGWSANQVLWDARFVDLLDLGDDDDVEISLLVGKAGRVPLQNLSAGQRCVAVFPLLLRNTRGPLIIDQPEDNLDNRYIADVISPDLLKRKQKQQFLVTSHNANLVVLGDADLVLHVDSDGATSRFVAAGFLACADSEIRKSVLDVLDGGQAALDARQRKYGPAKP